MSWSRRSFDPMETFAAGGAVGHTELQHRVNAPLPLNGWHEHQNERRGISHVAKFAPGCFVALTNVALLAARSTMMQRTRWERDIAYIDIANSDVRKGGMSVMAGGHELPPANELKSLLQAPRRR